MQISSASNDRVKHAKRVRDGREPELIFVEGLRLAEECHRSGCMVETCLAAPDPGARATALIDSLTRQSTPILWTAPHVLESLAGTVQTQGVILLAKRPRLTLDALRAAEQDPADTTPLLLGLDRVQDPGNMGTLIRTAEAAGTRGILALGGSVDVFSPKVLRSSMGSAFRLPVLSDVTPDDLLALRRQLGVKVVAATGQAAMDYCDYDWRQPTLLLLGNEGGGVAPGLIEQCDARLRIPMAAGVESLNVAAAGAVMLFEAARQRRKA